MLLRDYLRIHDLTRRDFAGRIGISSSALTMMINNKRRPSWDTVFQIEDVTKGAVTITDWANQIRMSAKPYGRRGLKRQAA